jgi:exopolysaccharide biosynthesis polyprenyl glycosylphosphotransferase
MLDHPIAPADQGDRPAPASRPVTGATQVAAQVAAHAGPDASLRRRLLAVDAAALVAVWSVALAIAPVWRRIGIHGAVVLATVAALAAQRLYREQVAGVRPIESRGLVRAAAAGTIVGAATAAGLGVELSPLRLAVGAVGSLAALELGRSTYRAWLRASRAGGRFTRPIVLVGTNDEAADLAELVRVHPEHGYRVCGVVATDPVSPRFDDLGLPRLGHLDDLLAPPVLAPEVGVLTPTSGARMRGAGAVGAVIATTAVPYERLGAVANELLGHGLDVHLTTGLHGVDHSRLRWRPLARAPMLALEPPDRPAWHAGVKRTADVVVAAIVLILALPVLAVAALAIKVEDRGPVLFGHQRVGRGGREFRLLKLRTMVPDAERRLGEVLDQGLNDRTGGPLFKLERDPRVTRVGRLLRLTSLDELPQLVNVLRGQMSLVGPRPAPRSEVVGFDDELRRRRHTVRPGITGLWQVEARDNPEFGPYRRLDLFYLDNWSLALDLAILWTTAGRVVARTGRAAMHKHKTPTTLPGEPALDLVPGRRAS